MELNLKNISKSFGSIKILNNIYLENKKLECTGIIGPNGAGKSTLFKVITGNLIQEKGDIFLNNNNINNYNKEERARLGISQSFQKNSLFPEFTVIECLLVALSHTYNISFNFFSPLRKNKILNRNAEKIAEDIGLKDHINQKSENLSYGLQRQLELGLAISSNPDILLLDEPTAGMSQVETKSILKLLKSLSKKISIMIVEHDMDVIYNLVDKIIVLDRGTKVFQGKPKEVSESELVQKIYLGK